MKLTTKTMFEKLKIKKLRILKKNPRNSESYEVKLEKANKIGKKKSKTIKFK